MNGIQNKSSAHTLALSTLEAKQPTPTQLPISLQKKRLLMSNQRSETRQDNYTEAISQFDLNPSQPPHIQIIDDDLTFEGNDRGFL
jgi:hypothetical protein